MQETSGNAGHFVRFNAEADDAVPRMGESSVIEPHIAGEPCRAPKLAEERNNRFVVDPLVLDLTSDLTDAYPPTSEERSLVLGNVLIEQNHSAANSW